MTRHLRVDGKLQHLRYCTLEDQSFALKRKHGMHKYVNTAAIDMFDVLYVCLFVLLLYVSSQQLWSWRDGQFTWPHFFLGKLEQAINQYFVNLLSLVTDNSPS